MRLKSILNLLICGAACCLLLSCCDKKPQPKYRIGVSQCSTDDWRTKLNEEIMRENLFYDDIEVEIRSADDDNEKQKEDLRYFMRNGFDIIIAAPTEADALTPLIDSIYLSGKPIIIFDRHTNSDNYTNFQGADNVAVGRAAAQYALMLNKEPKVIELKGKLETMPAQERHKGFKQVADSAAALTVLSSAIADWTYEGGKRNADSLLRAYPQTNIIYAHNDRMAMGASEAAKALGMRDKVKIIGIDAAPQLGIKAVMDTVIDATFIYPTGGRTLIQSALAILNGNPPAKQIILPTQTAVNLTNAEILSLQNQTLQEETNSIRELKTKLDTYWQNYNSQTTVLYSIAAMLVFMSISVFLLLRGYWMQRRHNNLIEEQNQRLRTQHEEIESQYRQLSQKNEEINQILAQLQQATQSKLNFFTNVSHDLRTPLTLIAEPVQQLTEADNLTEKQQQLMQLASKNIKVLMRLINQILDFRKYENGRLNLHLAEVDLARLMRDWTEAFKEVATRKHLKFKVLIQEDSDFSIAIDTDKIERVLFNLISNAFKFTAPPGEVRVRLERTDSHIIFSVSDNGKGISPDEIGRVFEKFYKNDSVSPDGSGIGLALCKAFVELHGGSVDVKSEVGRGTIFTVRLPIVHVKTDSPAAGVKAMDASDVKSELSPVAQELPEPSEGASTILVIDDNPDICALIQTLLSDRFTVLHVPDGVQGIKLATKYVPDLIICDVMMPGIDGFETCRRLKSEVLTSHIPVLMLTACTLDEQKIEGYDCGVDAYLTKPFNSGMLIARINALLDNRKRLKDLYQGSEQTITPPAKNEDGAGTPKTGPLMVENEFYRQFIEIIEGRLADSEMNIDDVASCMNVSRVQLYRKIKSITNYAPTEIIKNLRLEKAAKMLKTSDATVSEVCYAVGFGSHSYFTKCYREYFGESPSDAQKRTSKAKS